MAVDIRRGEALVMALSLDDKLGRQEGKISKNIQWISRPCCYILSQLILIFIKKSSVNTELVFRTLPWTLWVVSQGSVAERSKALV